MDFSLLIQYVAVLIKEVWRRKFLCLFGFAIVSFSVLFIGGFWPSTFQTSATIFADNQNILKPLLEKQAAQSKVQNQTKVVRDMMHSPRILKKVVESAYSTDSYESAEELGHIINRLRSKIKITGVGQNYIKVSYSDSTSEKAYRVINSVIDVFIKISSDEQRSESREAFLFIDNQVNQYKDQLVQAEVRLKNFRADNFDGRDGDVDASISRLRTQIEELKIDIDEDKVTSGALKEQLSGESEYSSKQAGTDIYVERLATLEQQKTTLLLTYTDDYPDVVSLTYQIADVKKAIRDAAESKEGESNKNADENSVLNPLYQELRSRLSLVQTEIQAKEKRLIAFKRLKTKEFDRRRRIAERGAEESELTRDYTVTKRIYEDMLERKEKARLSMTLNIEGQGVTYRIQEPALPPLNPVGLRFLHFVLVAPFIGLFSVLGFALLYISLDPRIRFASKLVGLNVSTLSVIPHVNTSLTKRVIRFDMIICVLLMGLIMAAYIGLAYVLKLGMI